MAEFELVGWQLFNPKTGEIRPDALLIERKQKKVGGRWVRIYQDPLRYLAIQEQIRGETMRVFLLLTSVTGFQNLLPSQKVIAEKLGKTPAHISRAFKQLTDIGFIYKKEGNYYLNPHVGWKGSLKQMESACKELPESCQRYLALPQPSSVS